MTDIVKRDDMELAPETVQIVSIGGDSPDSPNQPNQSQSDLEILRISSLVRDMMAPIMESIGKMLEHNTQAMEQIAAAQQITSDRIASLEKRVRLQKPMSKSQENCINSAIRARARELLDNRGYADDKKAVTKLCGIIRKSVLARYGVGSLREAPAYDYDTAMKQVGMWKDMLAIRDVEKEARAREAEAVELGEQPAHEDVQEPVARPDH